MGQKGPDLYLLLDIRTFNFAATLVNTFAKKCRGNSVNVVQATNRCVHIHTKAVCVLCYYSGVTAN